VHTDLAIRGCRPNIHNFVENWPKKSRLRGERGEETDKL
jgi:hypothetical protein